MFNRFANNFLLFPLLFHIINYIMKSIKDINIKDKNILVRVDYNVPIKDGKITDDLRVRASLPTIKYLLENGANKVILLSHLGRPDGKENPEFSLGPVAETLRKLLPDQKRIGFYPLPKKGESVLDLYTGPDLKVILLENLRFDPGEEENSPEFIENLVKATKADLYIQDGFAVIHRAHASTDAIKNFVTINSGFLSLLIFFSICINKYLL